MEDVPSGLTRRQMLKRGAVFGGALVWAVPLVQAVGINASIAQAASGGSGGLGVTIKYLNQLGCSDSPDPGLDWRVITLQVCRSADFTCPGVADIWMTGTDYSGTDFSGPYQGPYGLPPGPYPVCPEQAEWQLAWPVVLGEITVEIRCGDPEAAAVRVSNIETIPAC